MGQYKTFTLVAKSGRGIVTSRSPQVLAEYTDSLSFLQNFLVKDGAWVARGDDVSSRLIAALTGPIYGIHYYNAIDPSNAAATPATVYLLHGGQNTDETGTSTLYRSDTGAAVTVNGFDFTTTTPSDIFFLNIKNRCFVAGTKLGTGRYPTIVTKYPSAASYRWGIDAPTADLTYDAYTDATNSVTLLRFDANAANVSNGSTAVTKAAGANWDTTNWDGKTVYLNDVPYTIVDVTGVGAMTINPAWVDDGAASPVNMRVHYGEVSWGELGPSYAYAYYNPTTGHISNVSPIMTISETNIYNVRVKISNIQLTNDPNYTKVVMFRTAFNNGGNLLPLRLDAGAAGTTATVDTTPTSAGYGMIENNAVGTVVYVDILSDPNLNKILGATSDVGAPAPFLNNPPPSDIRYMAFWDSRVWVVSAATRYRLQFSGNSGQIPLGVPEESFPATNYRDISADDGFITGLKTVGTSLLVCTERYLYFVDGGSENTYRLQRISSRGAGVDQYAIDEHPGDSSDQSASAIYVSRDKRLWRQYPGGRIEDIGWPIQDKLDNLNLSLKKPVVLKVCQVLKSWLLVLGIRQEDPDRYGYLFYDFDEQCWLDLNLGTPEFWGSSYGGYGSPWWSGVGAGVVYDATTSGTSALDVGGTDTTGIQRLRLMGNNVNGLLAALDTQHLDCGDKQAKKTFQELIIHTDETNTAQWQVYAQFDGLGGAVNALIPVPNTTTATSPRYMGTEVVRYVLPQSAGPAQYHTVRVAVGGYLSRGKHIFKVVVNYTVESTAISGSVS